MKVSPLYSNFKHIPARFADQNGWQIPDAITSLESELTALLERVALADLSASGKIAVEGKQAGGLIQTALNVDAPSLKINAGLVNGLFDVYRLRNDFFFLHTPPGQEDSILEPLEKICENLRKATYNLTTLTDITHGRAEIGIIGPQSAALLSRLCGLDFHPSQFPNLTARQSSVAKTPQLILRHDLGDLPAFALIGDRSLGAYLWETVMQAGRDLGVQVVGWHTLKKLELGE